MKTRRWVAWFSILSMLIMLAAGCASSTGQSSVGVTKIPEGYLHVHFIDIGQGDAILLQTDEKTVLIDTGDVPDEKKVRKLAQYIQKHGIKSLDALIITHPHADHLGGVQSVFETVAVKQIYDSGQLTTTNIYKQYLQAVKQKKIPFKPVRVGETIDIGDGIILTVLWPREPFLTGTNSDLNNNSVVVKLAYGSTSFLFTGDIEKEAEQILAKDPANLKSAILKVGHHGSNTSSSAEFLKTVKPEMAVISVGVDNEYHHPHPSTLKKLDSAKTKVYRTDLQGSIIVMTNGKEYQVKVEK